MTSVAIIVIAYKSRVPLTRFLESLTGGFDVLVVNNSAELDDLLDLETTYDGVQILDAGGNVGFSAGANKGAAASTAEVLIFMNPDTLPTSEAIGSLVDTVSATGGASVAGPTGIKTAGGGAQPTIGRVAAHVVGLHKVLPLSGLYFYPRNGERVEAGWISGSCCAIRREAFEAVGGFNDSYFVFMSDFELGLRLADAGYRQLVLGDVVVRHFDGGSSDLPAEWTWDQRGRGWAQFLVRTQEPMSARAMRFLLVAGFSVRRVVYTLLQRSVKAQEQAVMVAAIRDEWPRVKVEG